MVKIPVPAPIYCPVPELNRPALPVATLTGESPPADTMRAYAESIVILKGAVAQRDEILAACRRPGALK
jgi:hypothetical protein